MKTKIAEGDLVTVKGQTYGKFKVHKLLPKGAHGRKCMLAEVLHSAMISADPEQGFDFALIKVFRVVDLKRIE